MVDPHLLSNDNASQKAFPSHLGGHIDSLSEQFHSNNHYCEATSLIASQEQQKTFLLSHLVMKLDGNLLPFVRLMSWIWVYLRPQLLSIVVGSYF